MVHHKDCIISPATNYLRALAFGYAKKQKKNSIWVCQKKKKKIYFASSNTTLFILSIHFTTHFTS